MPLALRRMIDFGFTENNGVFIDRYFGMLIVIGAVLAVACVGGVNAAADVSALGASARAMRPGKRKRRTLPLSAGVERWMSDSLAPHERHAGAIGLELLMTAHGARHAEVQVAIRLERLRQPAVAPISCTL